MIKQLIKALSAAESITGWLIEENATQAAQAFYVLQKLETTRLVDTKEYNITVYREFSDNGNMCTGSSTFALSHKLSNKELADKINEAAFAASLIKNKRYDLVPGTKKRSWKQQSFGYEPLVLLDKIADVFFAETKSNLRFNSLELFHSKITLHVVSSKGVDYKKTMHRMNIEAIPSFDGKDNKVELYRYLTYNKVDFDIFKNDAKTALQDVTSRYEAKAIKDVSKADVILRDEDVRSLFENLIDDYSYHSIYHKNTDKVIGDSIQKDVKGEYLTIALKPASKADGFDRDGILLSPINVIDKGVIANYYGSNQYGQYLGIKACGSLATIAVSKGKSSYAVMKNKPHLEIIALSGIQIDMYSHYIGGEVRLAVYFDGKNYHPVSGFSFSGNIDKCLSSLQLSREMVTIQGYEGPKYLMLKDMEIL
ncbi:MAG: metallopeptidase TldD-related protein [Bacilli bacterium]